MKDVNLSIAVVVCRFFGGTCCIHLQGGDKKFLRNIIICQTIGRHVEGAIVLKRLYTCILDVIGSNNIWDTLNIKGFPDFPQSLQVTSRS